MRALIIAAVALLLPTCARGQASASATADSAAIHDLLGEYVQAVDRVDLKLLAQIWSHSPEVSFIYPLGEEHGYEAIEQHVFQKVMGGMFSARDLTMHDVAIHVNGAAAAWSEFHWDFHATLRKDGSAVTTHGIETQIYRKEEGDWRLVHVHYSEDRQSTP
jgi:ketosteroid isomerase-like protein